MLSFFSPRCFFLPTPTNEVGWAVDRYPIVFLAAQICSGLDLLILSAVPTYVFSDIFFFLALGFVIPIVYCLSSKIWVWDCLCRFLSVSCTQLRFAGPGYNVSTLVFVFLVSISKSCFWDALLRLLTLTVMFMICRLPTIFAY